MKNPFRHTKDISKYKALFQKYESSFKDLDFKKLKDFVKVTEDVNYLPPTKDEILKRILQLYKIDDLVLKNNRSTSIDFNPNPDLRIMFMPRIFDVDFDTATEQDLIQAYGPEGAHWKSIYDIAKAHNFEGKYAEFTLDKIKAKLDKYFPISKSDPDILLGISRARSVYNIPDFRKRFDRFGDISKSFLDDVNWRLDNVELQGLDVPDDINVNFGLRWGARAGTREGNAGRITFLRYPSSSSRLILEYAEHEAGHITGRHPDTPGFITLYNKQFLPTPRLDRDFSTNERKYFLDLDELITRSKTALRYAHDNNLSIEELLNIVKAAPMRRPQLTKLKLPIIPRDVEDLVDNYTTDSLVKWLEHFVGGSAAVVTSTALTDEVLQEKDGGKLSYLDYLKSGGGIHIKKANKGKFTETKKRTGKSTEELTHSKNPLTRKRAIFALNAKKWNHKK